MPNALRMRICFVSVPARNIQPSGTVSKRYADPTCCMNAYKAFIMHHLVTHATPLKTFFLYILNSAT